MTTEALSAGELAEDGLADLREDAVVTPDDDFHRVMDAQFSGEARRVVIRTPADAVLPLRSADWVELYAGNYELVEHVVTGAEDVRTYGRRPQQRHSLPGRLVITVTSYAARFPTLDLTLRRLLHQTVTADEVVLWLSAADEARLPERVRALTERGLTIKVTEDIRSYKKIIPALREYADCYLLTVDDDQIYPLDTVAPLVEAYRTDSEVLCRRAHAVLTDAEGRIRPYAQWRHEIEAGEAGEHVFPTGCGGTLFPPGVLAPEVLDEEAFLALAPEADDIWLYWMMRRAGHTARVVGTTWLNETWPGSQTTSLMDVNWKGGNDRQIAALTERFGVPLESRVPDAPTPGAQPREFDSADYWSRRYVEGGNSGAGSYGRLAQFKAAVINDFVAEHRVRSVIEFGSGDGAQLALATYPSYLGFDVAERSLEMCRERFAGDATKSFLHTDSFDSQSAELTLSLDVIYHLIEDDVFDSYMARLFDASSRFVIVYASNVDERSSAEHVRHRRFTDWVARERPDFVLTAHIPNPYPLVDDPVNESFADFYVFERPTAGSPAPVAVELPWHGAEDWQPTKYALVDGLLKASDDTRELNPSSVLVAELTARFYNRVIPDFAHGRLLDLGCGKQPMYGLYRHFVDEVVAADWESSLHDNPRIDVFCDLGKVLPFDDASFDTVIFSDVLEHLPDPALAMSEIARILRHGGVLLLNTPFLYWIHEAPHDFYRHTRFSLERLVREAGLELPVLAQLGGAFDVLADVVGKLLPRFHPDGAAFGRSLQQFALQRHAGSGAVGVEEDQFPLAYGLVASKP